jgi:hypothetical protein
MSFDNLLSESLACVKPPILVKFTNQLKTTWLLLPIVVSSNSTGLFILSWISAFFVEFVVNIVTELMLVLQTLYLL